MNPSALKSFAQETRRELHRQVGLRLAYWVGAEGSESRVDSAEHRQFAPQIQELEAACEREGRPALIERVAYLWFNRIAALRFMDANGYHPFGAKVIMPATVNDTLPEILQQARAGVMDGDVRRFLTNAQALDDILAGRIPVAHPEQAVYRLALVAVCNYYQRLMPFLFERIGDATELLLPEDLLTEHSVAHAFRTELTDEDCRDVEVIGWLYQFYISEKKDAVMARDTAVPKEDIPAVTQLFTPHWIVRYLVENSLGRLWLQNRPLSRLRETMPYHVEVDSGEGVSTDHLQISSPEEIRLIDPACGSGHMLTYAYDLLYAIYAEEGYDAPKIPGLILKHNLYGVEICDRAAALAAFALCMKARGSDNRFFRRVTQPNVISLQDVRFEAGELQEYIRALGLGDLFSEPVRKLLHQFEEAKNLGSLIQPCLDAQAIADLRRAIEAKDLGGQLFLRETHSKVLRVLEQAEYLCQRYHTVVANPPYMSGTLNGSLGRFMETNYGDSRNDLSAAFVTRCSSAAVNRGFSALVTMHSWMFISTLERLRRRILREKQLVNLVHHGIGAFPSLNSKVVQTAAFVFEEVGPRGAPTFVDIRDAGTAEKETAALAMEKTYSNLDQNRFLSLPGACMAYWLSAEKARVMAEGRPLAEIERPRAGISTGGNERFIRYWHEPSHQHISFGARSRDGLGPFFPHNKAGGFRKWYGHALYVLRYDDPALAEMEGMPGFRHDNADFYFKPSVSWGKVTSGDFSSRFYPGGFTFDSAGLALFPARPFVFLGLLNSIVFSELLAALSQTLNFTVGDIGRFPMMDISGALSAVAEEAWNLARTDWDNFETSWDFRDLPLRRSGQWTLDGDQTGGNWKGATLEESWNNWKAYCDAAIRRMQELETENNRLFIEAYGLQDELKPEVPEEQITLARAEAKKDMAAFVSYAVGCMFGRYSLDAPGLILADAGATVADYRAKVPNPIFAPDEDGILPVLDGDWFPDDIVARFREFLKATFGEKNFDANLAFVEASLGRDLRKYFFRDFYKNHLSNERAYGYKKRPIYWMFSSPEGSFQALIYLHRYTRDTVNLLLNEYVREFIHKLEERQHQLTTVRGNEAVKTGERARAAKELGRIEKMLRELHGWERDLLLPIAQQRIEIDLDDGVKVNYLKFKGALVPIPGLEKKEEE